MLETTRHAHPGASWAYDFGDPSPNAVGRLALVPHDGCVVHLDRRSAPRVLWYGEELMEAKLPPGTRAIYANPTIPALPDRAGAIRYALDHPEMMDPLRALVRPGMKVTIAIDDISLPIPRMRRPDIRETAVTAVLDVLAERGVEDVHIIVAISFHRRDTPAELRHMVGDRIFGAFYPDRLYNHDAEDPEGMVELGVTDHGEHVRVNRRAAESDLLVYVNVNLVPMDGGSKSVGVGLCDYRTLQAHHTPQTIRASRSLFDHARSELTRSCDRIGRVLNRHLKVFHVETAINNNTFGPEMRFLLKNEDRYTAYDRAAMAATMQTLRRMPRGPRRTMLHAITAPYGMTAVHAGETFAVHEKTLAYCYAQYGVPVEGQTDVVIFGVPYAGGYNVGSVMNPLLVQTASLGYFHNMYRGMPLVKQNGVMILTHPLDDEWDTNQHPSYVEFFRRVLPETRDAVEMQRRYEAEFARDPDYIRLYRTGTAYHGVHPFYMWYWGEGGRQHVGKVIVVGARDREVARILGWETAATMDEALEMAHSHVGRAPSVSFMHLPPIGMVDVAGTPESV